MKNCSFKVRRSLNPPRFPRGGAFLQVIQYALCPQNALEWLFAGQPAMSFSCRSLMDWFHRGTCPTFLYIGCRGLLFYWFQHGTGSLMSARVGVLSGGSIVELPARCSCILPCAPSFFGLPSPSVVPSWNRGTKGTGRGWASTASPRPACQLEGRLAVFTSRG